MPRVKRGVTAKARHKKVLKAAKGYYGARSRSFRVANQAVTKAGQYAYRDRKVRKREFRALWMIVMAKNDHAAAWQGADGGFRIGQSLVIGHQHNRRNRAIRATIKQIEPACLL